jgi:hypothetical protein|tara:strand:+ start:11179 stop:11517 length:339 start_codon:yes stop_codon:yes gene_type:complete
MATYSSNLVINTNEDYIQTFDLASSADNSALNLTDYTVSSQMRKYAGSTNATDFTATIVSPATSGKVSIALTSGATSSLKEGRYVYDIVIEKDSVKTKVVEGMVIVVQGVTR